MSNLPFDPAEKIKLLEEKNRVLEKENQELKVKEIPALDAEKKDYIKKLDAAWFFQTSKYERHINDIENVIARHQHSIDNNIELIKSNQHSIDVNTPQPEMPPSSEGILEYTWKRRSDWLFYHGVPLFVTTVVANRVFKFNRVKSAFSGFCSDQTLDYLKKVFKQS